MSTTRLLAKMVFDRLANRCLVVRRVCAICIFSLAVCFSTREMLAEGSPALLLPIVNDQLLSSHTVQLNMEELLDRLDRQDQILQSLQESKLQEKHGVGYDVGYDEGFWIKPLNSQKKPFSIKFNGRLQFRHIGFARDVDTWTNNAGITRDVRNRNTFDIERARLLLYGMAIDPRMTYFLQIDGDTDGRHVVDFFDYWWAWKFSDLLQIQMGMRKVPGSRQWLLGAFDTMFADRAIATDFFRPDRTVGIWLRGDLTERMHYEAMIGNGYRTTNLPLSLQNDQFSYALTQWVDLGQEEFGKTFADDQCGPTPTIQLGHSFTAASQSGTVSGIPLGESDFVRLSDGTRLTAPNALAPGTQVDQYDIYMYAVDAAWKYHGWSMNGELFFRWLDDIGGTGNLQVTNIFDRGFYLQSSVTLIPKTVYVAGRVSQVRGPHGNHYEYAGAVNWFIHSNHNLKLTFDVTSLDGSPLNNTTSDILVGDSGLLFRTQFQTLF